MTTRATELECERTIIDAAKLGGWLIHGTRTAWTRGRHTTPIKGHAGFPDLVLVHPERRHVWFVELKRRPNRIEPDQARWHDALAAAGADVRIWWVPDQLDEVCRFLVAGKAAAHG